MGGPKGPFKRFTDAERDYIRVSVETMSYQQIADALGRDWKSISKIALKNGWGRRKHLLWTPEEEQFVRDHLDDMTYPEMAKKLGRKPDAVRGYALGQLGLRKSTSRPWTEEDDEFLREASGGVLTLQEMALLLERSWMAVGQRIRVLGLATWRKGGYWQGGQHLALENKMGPDWSRLRIETFERDGYTCQEPGCGLFVPSGKGLHVHHIKPRKFGVDDRYLVTLCEGHHNGQPAHYWIEWTPEHLPAWQIAFCEAIDSHFDPLKGA